MENLLIELRNASVVINHKQIIDNIDLSIKKKSIITITGPNGGGKTTLLRVLLGLEKIFSGTLLVKAKKLSYLPQSINISRYFNVTVEDFIFSFCDKINFKENEIFKTFEILNLLNSNLNTLSGGELRRVFLATIIFSDCDLCILDEPEQCLDQKFRRILYHTITELKKEKSFLLVSHDPNIVALGSDQIVCINQKIHCIGKAKVIDPARSENDIGWFDHR